MKDKMKESNCHLPRNRKPVKRPEKKREEEEKETIRHAFTDEKTVNIT